MGWKSVKEHYRIEHLVHVRNGNLCIGSEAIRVLHIIAPNGEYIRGEDKGSLRNENLVRYQQEIEAAPEVFARLFAEDDSFVTSLPVFLLKGAEIIEKRCEARGWPNVTHDGLVLEDGEHAGSLNEAVGMAKALLERDIRFIDKAIETKKRHVQRYEGKIEECHARISALNKKYPDTSAEERLSEGVDNDERDQVT